MNYFELLNLSAEYSIDSRLLSNEYQSLQREYHPDNFATASEQEQRLAVQKSALLNDAYQTLKDPIRRAEHLMTLKGIELPSEEQTVKDISFLMQQMEYRERLEAIEHVTDIESEIDAFGDEIQSVINKQVSQLAIWLSEPEPDTQCVECVRQLKFYYKLLGELSLLEDKLL